MGSVQTQRCTLAAAIPFGLGKLFVCPLQCCCLLGGVYGLQVVSTPGFQQLHLAWSLRVLKQELGV